MSSPRWRLHERTTGTLRSMIAWLDALPASVMADLRRAIKEELASRELPGLADEAGGHLCAAPEGVQ